MKRIWSMLLRIIRCAALLLEFSSNVEKEKVCETMTVQEGWGFDGDPFEFIALRHQIAGIQRWFDFYCRYADEGEDTGASAKVYILHDTSLRIFIEVTDKELVDPTAEQQVEQTTGIQSFDCVQIILKTKNG